MAAAMIGYMLGDASLLQPVLQWGLGQTVVETHKNLVSRFAVLIAVIKAYQFQSLVADGCLMSLLRKPVRQEKRKAFFNTSDWQGVLARLTNS